MCLHKGFLRVLLGLSLFALVSCSSPAIEDMEIVTENNFDVAGETYSTLQDAVDAVTSQQTAKGLTSGSSTTITLLSTLSGPGAKVADAYTGNLSIDFGPYTYTVNIGKLGIDFNQANGEILSEPNGGLDAANTTIVTKGSLTIPASFQGKFEGKVNVQEQGTLVLECGDTATIKMSELQLDGNSQVTFGSGREITINRMQMDENATIQVSSSDIIPRIVTSNREVQNTIEDKFPNSIVSLRTEATQMIEEGIADIEDKKYDEGVAKFNEAYELEQTDETRIYSALATLASISTKQATQDFVKNRLGITNYPATMNALFDTAWLEATDKYWIDKEEEIYSYSGIKEATTEDGGYGLYYRASLADNSTAGAFQIENDGWTVCKKASIEGQDCYPTLWNLREYEINKKRKSDIAFGNYYVLSEDGEYYVARWSLKNEQVAGWQAYTFTNSEDISYKYKEYSDAFVMNLPEWIKDSSMNTCFPFLVVANVLNGNSKGLNEALDELYSIIFGTAYEEACKKIDAIERPVKVPERVIVDFGFDDVVGKSSVYIGPTEMKLIKASFDALEATFEYFQSYDLDMPSILESMKFDWAEKEKWGEKFTEYLDRTSTVDTAYDLLNNGFLGVRDAQKMEDAKKDFISAIDLAIAAYDDIVKNNNRYLYPTVMMDKLEEYKALRTAATALKDGIAQRTKFYIPDSIQANMTWPETGNRWLDLGMLFNNENYTLAKFIVMESDRNVPRIRILKEKNGVVAPVKQISFAKEGIRDTQLFTLDYLDSEAVELVLDILEDSKNTLSEDAVFGLEINLSPINETIGGMEFEDHTYFLKFPETFALLLYNFYHDGQYTARIKNVMETRGWFHP